jgi:hypothetical protein
MEASRTGQVIAKSEPDLVLPANPFRLRAEIRNIGTSRVYVGVDAKVDSTTGHIIEPNAKFTMKGKGPLYVVASGLTGQTVSFFEESEDDG